MKDVSSRFSIPRTRNSVGFALAAVIACAVITWAQPAAQTGSLKAPARIAIVMDGKTVGATTLPAGTKVTILNEAGEKVLVRHSAGTTWVEKTTVELPATASPATPAPEPSTLESLVSKAGDLADAGMKAVAAAKAQAATVAGALSPQGSPPAATIPAATPKKEEPQKELKGSALTVFLITGLQADLEGNVPDPEGLASQIVKGLHVSESDLPQAALAAVNGTVISLGKTKGILQVTITAEADHTQNPGFSSSDMGTLKAALTSPKTLAVARLQKSNWKIEDGTCAPDKTCHRVNPATVLLSDYDPATDSFLCRKSQAAEPGRFRIKADDAALCGVAFATASVAASENTKGKTELPADFHYDRTLILPGQFGYLAVPFIKQLPKGICTAAAALNVIKFIDPSIELEQTELFALFNNGTSGATLEQLEGGLENMGFETESVTPSTVPPRQLAAKIQASIEGNLPLIAFVPGHALTIIGFDKSTRKLLGWDQRARGSPLPNGMPAGSFEVTEGSLPSKFDVIIFVRKAYETPSREEEAALQAFVGKAKDLRRHIIVNSNPDKELLANFARHSVPQRIAALLKSGRTVLIPNGKTELVSISPQEIKKEGVLCKTLPSGETKARTLQSLSTKNPFFSSSNTK